MGLPPSRGFCRRLRIPAIAPLGRLLGGRFGLRGSREFGGELGLGDPPGLDAGVHDQELAFLARQLEAVEKSGVASGFAVLAVGPARQIVGGTTGKILKGFYTV